MGFQDRDYYRAPRPSGGIAAQMSTWSVTTWLIAINVAVFVLDTMTHRLLSVWGYFSIEAAISYGQVWRFVTFQFLHANLGHIFFNMLALYFFGPMVENYLGPRRYLAFYLLSGVAGAGMYILLYLAHVLITDPGVRLVGASAGIFGILMAAVQIAPNARVMLMFPPIPMKARTFVILFGVGELVLGMTGWQPGVAHFAHLGGMLFGWLLIRYWRGQPPFNKRRPPGPPKRPNHLRSVK